MSRAVHKEYEEEDIDLDSLLEASCSQHEDSVLDIDSILRPLSDSQQEMEANLDLRDQKIRDEIATQEEKRVRSEQEQVMIRHKVTPALIKRKPPGLNLLQPEQLLTFSMTDLSLETDFGWTGRKRLEQSGLPSSFVERLVGGQNVLMMVRYLAPETGQNNMVANEEEFQSMVDYVFYLSTVCEDQLTFSVLSKCLFDLLKSCGHPWHVTTSHLLATLLNLGARDQVLASEQFYQMNLASSGPVLPQFYTARLDNRQGNKVISQQSRLVMLRNSVQLVGDLLRLPDRNHLGQNTTSLLTMVYLAITVGQDQAVVDTPSITRSISQLLHSLLSLLPPSPHTETHIQDMAELLSAGFLPHHLCPSSTSTWSYTSLPAYMATAGHNHPHNMLTSCSLLPPHSSIKHLLAYLYIQLVLGVTSVDLPGQVTTTDLVQMLDTHKGLWGTLAKDQHYSMWSVLGLMDIMVEGEMEELKVGTDQFDSLKKLVSLLEQYLGRVGRNDPLNLDPVTVGELAAEMASRWKMAVNTAENIHSMKVQTGLTKEAV
eukprot:GFUD01041012.1.p1 GENE.GFUD01041012.1~~GFUD01041012.1.p1  ORF type:complete len:570 (+),score=193.85 GFUD01041012.1:87-1712(+)